ncbi:hypothetical protein BOTBODRAFT_211996 [Botryobasidium botryosum FD-172 SS1]|uniref:Uncharacterized protein n=1 Tax=Botryobasidium botryosum (strain FD-172 SS1) TaxID=930990 RepID=A0A067N1J1_BOTB1|nr:hypothetical protein BOTBODRAFT_211996 [Botryobasidium botryosum FD-172 SS1]
MPPMAAVLVFAFLCFCYPFLLLTAKYLLQTPAPLSPSLFRRSFSRSHIFVHGRHPSVTRILSGLHFNIPSSSVQSIAPGVTISFPLPVSISSVSLPVCYASTRPLK